MAFTSHSDNPADSQREEITNFSQPASENNTPLPFSSPSSSTSPTTFQSLLSDIPFLAEKIRSLEGKVYDLERASLLRQAREQISPGSAASQELEWTTRVQVAECEFESVSESCAQWRAECQALYRRGSSLLDSEGETEGEMEKMGGVSRGSARQRDSAVSLAKAEEVSGGREAKPAFAPVRSGNGVVSKRIRSFEATSSNPGLGRRSSLVEGRLAVLGRSENLVRLARRKYEGVGDENDVHQTSAEPSSPRLATKAVARERQTVGSKAEPGVERHFDVSSSDQTPPGRLSPLQDTQSVAVERQPAVFSDHHSVENYDSEQDARSVSDSASLYSQPTAESLKPTTPSRAVRLKRRQVSSLACSHEEQYSPATSLHSESDESPQPGASEPLPTKDHPRASEEDFDTLFSTALEESFEASSVLRASDSTVTRRSREDNAFQTHWDGMSATQETTAEEDQADVSEKKFEKSKTKKSKNWFKRIFLKLKR